MVSSSTPSLEFVMILSLQLRTQPFSGNMSVVATFCITLDAGFRGGPLWCTRFRRVFGLENGPVKSDKSQEKTLFGKEMPEDASRHPKPTSYPQNPPRHSRKSVSDGVIQLRVPLAGCAGFFLQAPIPRRILTKIVRSHLLHEHALCKAVVGAPRASKSASRHSVVRVVGLGNSKLCEFPQRGACTISV